MKRRMFLATLVAGAAPLVLPLSRLLPQAKPQWWQRAAQDVARFSEGRLALVNAPDRTWAAAIMDKAGRIVAYVDETSRVWWPAIADAGHFERGTRLVAR